MCIISVVMPTCDEDKYLFDAIQSVLRQSFEDWELVIPVYGVLSESFPIIQSFEEERIRLVGIQPNYVKALNKGIETSSGKYIAFMSPDTVMHVDRLRIQYALMEEEPSITVSAIRATSIGSQLPPRENMNLPGGLIEDPLLFFLRGNYIQNSTVILRKDFVLRHNIHYEDYPYAEDLRFYCEIARDGGAFYVDNQPLLYVHSKVDPEIEQKKKEEQTNIERIMDEMLTSLVDKNKNRCPEMAVLCPEFRKLCSKGMITRKEMVAFFRDLIENNKDKLSTTLQN